MERVFETLRRLRLPGIIAALAMLVSASAPEASDQRPAMAPTVGVWTQQADAPGSLNGSAFYEPSTDLVRVFSLYSDYEYLASNTWTLSTNASRPPGVTQPSFDYAYDPFLRRYLVPTTSTLWARGLSDGAWTSSPILGSPPPYVGPCVFDPIRSRVIVLNYGNYSMYALNIDGAPEWSYLGTFPSSPFNSLFYDAMGDRLVGLMGTAQLWSLPLDQPVPTWTFQAIGGIRPETSGAAIVYDVRGHRIVYWGGYYGDAYDYPTTVWVMNLSGSPVWSSSNPWLTPLGRLSSCMAYDFVRDRLVMTGGWKIFNLAPPIYYDDTWTLPLNNPGAGHLALDPAVVNLGTEPGPSQGTMEISNVGTMQCVIFAVASSDPNVQVDTRAFALGPGQARTLTFTWNGVVPAPGAAIRIESSDPTAPVRNVHIAGHWLLGVAETGARGFGLALAGRNPGAGSARLELTMATREVVEVAVYDLRGSVVRKLVEGVREAGRHPIAWDGEDETGRRAGGGIYFVRARAGAVSSAAKVVLTR